MVTAANKEAARDAYAAGEAALRQKQCGRAAKLLRKALQLDPLIEAAFPTFTVLLNEAEDGAAKAEDGADEADAGQDQENERSAANAESADAAERNSQQYQAVIRILNNQANYYNVLGVARNASDSEITKSFRKLSLLVHPDKNKHTGAVEAFKILNSANTTLTDAAERLKYDQKIYGFGGAFGAGFNGGYPQPQPQPQYRAPQPQAPPSFPPSKPFGMACMFRSANMIRVSWMAPAENGSPITSYTLYVDEAKLYTGPSMAFEVQGLRPNTRHSFKVCATNARGSSPFSDTFWVETDFGMPSTPAAPTVVAGKSRSAKISWTAPEDNGGSPITEYEVEVNGARAYQGPERRHTLKDLKPATAYRVRVLAKNKAYPSSWSAATEFVTDGAPPARPVDLRAVGVPGGLEVSWLPALADENAGAAEGYALFVNDREVYRGERPSFRVAGLKPATAVKVTVLAYNRWGEGPRTAATKAKTEAAAPGRPAPPRLVRATAMTLELEFEAPGDNGGASVRSFVLRQAGEETDPYSGVLPACTIRALRPATAYRFRVAARNERGLSEFSEEAEFFTVPGAPGRCEPPRVEAFGATWVELAWEPPAEEHGAAVAGYALSVNGKVVFEGAASRWRVERLAPATRHAFAVAARNSAGMGPASDATTQRTRLDVAQRLPPPRVSQAAGGEVAVEVGYFSPEREAQPDEAAAVTAYLLFLDGRPVAAAAPAEAGAACFLLPGLPPCTSFSFRAAALNEAGLSRLSHDTRITTRAAPPGRVAGARASAAGAGRVELEWERVEAGADGAQVVYEVHLERGRAPAGALSPLWAGAEPRCTLDGLKANESYTFSVAARNAEGAGERSEPAHVTTAAAPPEAPLPPVRRGCGSSWARVVWSAPASNGGSPVTSYVLQMQPLAKPWETVYEGPATEFTANDLRPVILYKFRVAAVNALGRGEFGKHVAVLTDPGPPGAPVDLRLVEKSDERVALAWDHPLRDGGDPVRKYSLEIRVAGRGEFIEVYLGKERAYEIAGLLGGKAYELRVVALNSKGPGPYSDLLTVVTDAAAPDRPEVPPRAVAAGAEWIEVEWDPVNGRGDDNVMYMLQMRGEGKDVREAYRGPECRARVEGLAPRSEYRFRLLAANSRGHRGWTQVSILSTGACELPPGLPEKLRVSEVTERTALLAWDPPAVGPRSVDEYILKMNGRVYYRGAARVYEAGRLRPDTEYVFEVAAANELGSSRFAPPLALRTLAPPEVQARSAAAPRFSRKGDNADFEDAQAEAADAAPEDAEGAAAEDEEEDEGGPVGRRGRQRRGSETSDAPRSKRLRPLDEEEAVAGGEERTPERASQGDEDGAHAIDVDAEEAEEEEGPAVRRRRRVPRPAADEEEEESGGEGGKRRGPELKAPAAKKPRAASSAPKQKKKRAGSGPKAKPGLFGPCQGDSLKQASIARFFGGPRP
eukprot:tig00000900_g5393.t1